MAQYQFHLLSGRPVTLKRSVPFLVISTASCKGQCATVSAQADAPLAASVRNSIDAYGVDLAMGVLKLSKAEIEAYRDGICHKGASSRGERIARFVDPYKQSPTVLCGMAEMAIDQWAFRS